MIDIFISYSRQDVELVSKLAATLEEQGYNVWWDVHGLHGGQAFANEIQRAINEAKCAIVVWSEASVTSNWVHSEATQADSQGILLTALYQDAQVPLPFNNRHNESLHDWQGDPNDPNFQKLLKAIGRYCVLPADRQQINAAELPEVMPLLPQVAAVPAGETVVLGFASSGRIWGGAVLTVALGVFLALVYSQDKLPIEGQLAETPVQVEVDPVSATPTPAAIEQVPKYALTIHLEPKSAQVQLTLAGIESEYEPGMLLEAGAKYQAQISAPGYIRQEINRIMPENDQVVTAKLVKLISPKMIPIPAGTFRMGCVPKRDEAHGACDKKEKPEHNVNISKFWMAEKEVTVGQFRAFVDATGYKTTAEVKGSCWESIETGVWWKHKNPYSWKNPGFPEITRPGQQDQHPVVCVSLNDAHKYVEWLKRETGYDYRLPSEAEWEYAARGGNDNQANPWGRHGRDSCDYANTADQSIKVKYPNWNGVSGCDDGYVFTAPVGSFTPNKFSLYDMHGNVAEWVDDIKHSDYWGAPLDGSVWHKGGSSLRMIRGGSWRSKPWSVRSAARDSDAPHKRYVTLGFRPVMIK